jgi:DNA mismatch repair protein MutS
MHDHIVFLRKVVPGGSEHSFGIHVAKMAGIPEKVVRRAEEILRSFEEMRDQMSTPVSALHNSPVQLSIFQLDDPLLAEIRDEIVGLDINQMTPIEAIQKLHVIQQKLTRNKKK